MSLLKYVLKCLWFCRIFELSYNEPLSIKFDRSVYSIEFIICIILFEYFEVIQYSTITLLTLKKIIIEYHYSKTCILYHILCTYLLVLVFFCNWVNTLKFIFYWISFIHRLYVDMMFDACCISNVLFTPYSDVWEILQKNSLWLMIRMVCREVVRDSGRFGSSSRSNRTHFYETDSCWIIGLYASMSSVESVFSRFVSLEMSGFISSEYQPIHLVWNHPPPTEGTFEKYRISFIGWKLNHYQ